MLQAKKIDVRYNDKLKFKGAKLRVVKEEVFYLLKLNENEKTTTLNVFLGTEKLSDGEDIVNNISVKTENSNKTTLGYTLETVQLYKNLSAVGNLDFYCQLEGKIYTEERLVKFLREVKLKERLHRKEVKTYSKEMRQKVIKAIALAKNASYILIDKSTSESNVITSTKYNNAVSNTPQKVNDLMINHDIFKTINTCKKMGAMKGGISVYLQGEKSKEVEKIEEINQSMSILC